LTCKGEVDMPKRTAGQKELIIQRIISEALRRGYSAPEIFALLAIANIESDYNPRTIGDKGKSFGLFQVNEQRFSRYGVTPQTAQKLLDVNYQIPRVFDDFEQLRTKLRQVSPDIFHEIPTNISPEEFEERLAKAFVLYGTYWNRPAFLDEVLRDPRAFAKVYPKVPRDVMRRKLKEAYQYLMRFMPHAARTVERETAGLLAQALGLTVSERTEAPSSPLPYTQVRPTAPPPPGAEAPILAELSQLAPQLPQMYAMGKTFLQIIRPYVERKEKPPIKYEFKTLPDYKYADEDEKIVGHILQQFVPGFENVWRRMRSDERVAAIATIKSALRDVAPLYNRLSAERDPQRKRELQAQIDRRMREMLLRLHQNIPTLRAFRPPSWRLAGEIIKEMGTGFFRDVFAFPLIIAASTDYRKDTWAIRDPKTGEVKYVSYPEFVRTRIREGVRSLPLDKREAAVLEKLATDVLPTKPTAPLWLAYDMIKGALSDLVGGIAQVGASLGDWVMRILGKETRAGKYVEQLFTRWGRLTGYYATELARDPEFRRRHEGYAFNFLIATNPDAINRRTMKPTEHGWYLYAQHFVLSMLQDIANYALSDLIPERYRDIMRETLIHRAPILGFAASLLVPGSTIGIASKAVGKAAAALRLSERATHILQTATRGLVYTVFGMPEEVLRPAFVSRVGSRIAETALRGITEEGTTIWQQAARMVGRPSGALVSILKGGVKDAIPWEDFAKVYQRSMLTAETIFDALTGSTIGLIYMSPPFGDERDYMAGMLAGLGMSMGMRIPSLLVGKAWNRIAEKAGLPVSGYQVPPEIGLRVWERMRGFIRDVMGIESIISPGIKRPQAEAERIRFGQAIRKLFGDELATAILDQVWEDYIRRRYPPLTPELSERLKQLRPSIIQETTTWVYQNLPEELRQKIEAGQPLQPSEMNALQNHVFSLTVRYFTQEKKFQRPPSEKLALAVFADITRSKNVKLVEPIKPPTVAKDRLSEALKFMSTEVPQVQRAVGRPNITNINDLAAWVLIRLPDEIVAELDKPEPVISPETASALKQQIVNLTEPYFGRLTERQREVLREHTYRRILDWHNKLPPEAPTAIAPYRPPVTIPRRPEVVIPPRPDIPTAIVPYRPEGPTAISPQTPPQPGRIINPTLDDIEQVVNFVLTNIANDPKAAQDARGLFRSARKIYGESSEGVEKALEATTLMQAAKTAARKAEFLLYHMQKYGLLPEEVAKNRRAQVRQLFREYEQRFSKEPHVVKVRENAIEFVNRLSELMNEVIGEARIDDEVKRAMDEVMREPSVTVLTSVPQEPVPGERRIIANPLDPKSQAVAMLLSGYRIAETAVEPEIEWTSGRPQTMKVIYSFSRDKTLSYIEALRGNNFYPFVYRATEPEGRRENWVIVGIPRHERTPEEAAQRIADALISLLGGSGHTTEPMSFDDILRIFEDYNPYVQILAAWYRDKERYRQLVVEDADNVQLLKSSLGVSSDLFTQSDWERLWFRTVREMADNPVWSAWEIRAMNREEDKVKLQRVREVIKGYLQETDIPLGFAFIIAQSLPLAQITQFTPELNYNFIILNRRFSLIKSLMSRGMMDEVNMHLGIWFSTPPVNWNVRLRSDLQQPLSISISEHYNTLEMRPEVYEDFVRFYFERYMNEIIGNEGFPSPPLYYFVEFLKTRPDLQQHVSMDELKNLLSQLERQYSGRGLAAEIPLVTQPISSLLPLETVQRIVQYVEQKYPNFPPIREFVNVVLNTPVVVVKGDELFGHSRTWGTFDAATPHVVYVYDTFPVERSVILHEQMHKFINRLTGTPPGKHHREEFVFRQFDENPEAFYDLIPIILNPQRILRMMPSLEDPMFVPTLMEIIRRAPHPYIKDGDDFSLQSFLKYSVLVSLHTSDRTITQLNRSRRLLEKVIQHGLSALDEVQRNSLMFAFRWVDALIRELGVTDPRYIPPILSTRIPLALRRFNDVVMDVYYFLRDVGLREQARELVNLRNSLPMPFLHETVLSSLFDPSSFYSVGGLLEELGPEYLVSGYRREIASLWQILNFIENTARELPQTVGVTMPDRYLMQVREAVMNAAERLNELPHRLIRWAIEVTEAEFGVPSNIRELAEKVAANPERLTNPNFARSLKQYHPDVLLVAPSLPRYHYPVNRLIEEMLTTTMDFIGNMTTVGGHNYYYARVLVDYIIPVLLDMATEMLNLVSRNPEAHVAPRYVGDISAHLDNLYRTHTTLRLAHETLRHLLNDGQLIDEILNATGRLVEHYRALTAIQAPSVSEVISFVRKNFPSRPLITEMPVERRFREIRPEARDLELIPSPPEPEQVKDVRDIIRAFLTPSRQPAYNTAVERILSDPILTVMSFGSGYKLYRALSGTLYGTSENLWRTFHDVLFPEIVELSNTVHSIVAQFHPQISRGGARGFLSMEELKMLDETFREVSAILTGDVATRIAVRLQQKGLPLEFADNRAHEIAEALVEDMWRLSAGILPQDITTVVTAIHTDLRNSPLFTTKPDGTITYFNPRKMWTTDISFLFERFANDAVPSWVKEPQLVKRVYTDLIDVLQVASTKVPSLHRWMNKLATSLDNVDMFESALAQFPQLAVNEVVSNFGRSVGLEIANRIVNIFKGRSIAELNDLLNDPVIVDLAARSFRVNSLLRRIDELKQSRGRGRPPAEFQQQISQLEEEVSRAVSEMAPSIYHAYRVILGRLHKVISPYLDLSVLKRYLDKQHMQLAPYLERSEVIMSSKFLKPLFRTHTDTLMNLMFDRTQDYPAPIRGAVHRFAEETAMREVQRLVAETINAAGVPSEYRRELVEKILQAWITDGIDGLADRTFTHPSVPQVQVTFSRERLNEVAQTVINNIANYLNDVELTYKVSRMVANNAVQKKLNNWARMTVKQDPATKLKQLIKFDGTVVDSDKVAQEFVSDLEGVARKYMNEITDYLTKRYGVAGEGYAITFLEGLADVNQLSQFIRDNPEVFRDIVRFIRTVHLQDLSRLSAGHFKKAYRHISVEDAERMISSFARARMRGGIEWRYLGILGLIGALATAYKAFPAISAALSTAYAILASAPITSVMTMAGAMGLAGMTLVGLLKGRAIFKGLVSNFGTFVERMEQVLSAGSQAISRGIDAVSELVSQIDAKLGSIIKSAAAEFIEAPGATPVDGMIDELVNSTKSGTNAIFAQKPLRDTVGRSAKLTRSEREQIAQATAQRVGIISILTANQQLMDTVDEFGKLTIEATLFLNGLQNIAKNRNLSNEFTRNYLAYVFLQFMKGQKDWEKIADTPLKDVWKRTLLSVPVQTPQGRQRQRFKVTDFEIEINGQLRNVGDLTVKELWNELYKHYGYTGWSYDSISRLDPDARFEVLRNAVSYLRHRLREFVKMHADPQLRAGTAFAAMALDGIRRVKWVLSDPETAASVEHHPVSRIFFVENLIESLALLEHPTVQQTLGQFGQTLRDFYRNYLDAIKKHDPQLYNSALQLYREGQRHLDAFIRRVENARIEDVPRVLDEWYRENEKLLRKWLITATRRIEVAGVDRPLAEQIRHMIAEPGAYVNSAWTRLVETSWDEHLLRQILLQDPDRGGHVAPFVANHPAAAIFREIAAGARPPKERGTPMKLWMFIGAAGESLAKRIAQSQKVSIDEVRNALNKVFYYTYTAARDPNTFRDFNAVFSRIDEPMRSILTSPSYRNYVESLAVNAAITASYLTNLLSGRALTGEIIFRGEPRINLIERAYFPLSPELEQLPNDIWTSLVADLADLLTGANDRIRVTRYGIGKRMFHYERTGRAVPKAEQFYNIMTNFFRTINAYNALLPYASVLKGLSVLAPKWLQPALTRELHLAVGSPLLRRGFRDAMEAFVDTLSRRAEGWELIASYLSQSVPMVSMDMAMRAGGIAARMLSVTQTTALAANLSSIVRQITTFPYAAARLVDDFGSIVYAIMPILHFPRALWISLKSQLGWELSPVERMLIDRLPALKARHEQTHRAAILRGVELITAAAREKGALANTVADLLDPTLPTDRKAAAFVNLDRQLSVHGTLSEKLLDWLMFPLQLFDEAMVLATAMAGMEAFISDAVSKRIPITDDVLRQALMYGASLAESVQATPNLSFAPVAFQDPRMAAFLGPVARQFVVVGFATAETASKLLLKEPVKAISDIVDVLRGRKQAGEALDAIEQLSKALVAVAVMNLGLLALNALYQSVTGRQLEEVPLGYPPDDQSLHPLNLIEEGIVAMTPRAVTRLTNMLSFAFLGQSPATYDTMMTTDVPPIVRGFAQTANLATKAGEFYRAFSILHEMPKFKDASFWEKVVKSLEYMRRGGTDVAKVSAVADMLWLLMAIASINPTAARAVQWFPLGQLSRTARAVTEMRRGLPMPAIAELGDKWQATTIQALAGLPWAYGQYPAAVILQRLAGPVTEIMHKREAATLKAHDFVQLFRPIPPQGVFVGLAEYARRANNATDINAVQKLTEIRTWRRYKDSLFAQSVKEFIEAANTSEDEMYKFIVSKPNEFIAMMLIFGPEEIGKHAGKAAEKWFHNGAFVPQFIISELRRYGYITPDKEAFANYLLGILQYASQTNLHNYVLRKSDELKRRQRMQRRMSEIERRRRLREEVE
jgi:hypothetical protein